MLNRLVAALLVVLCASMLAACSKSPEKKIVGTWYEFGSTETVEFFADGTLRIVDDKSTMTGNYSFLDERNLRVELGGMGALAGPMVIAYEFVGDTLKMTYDGDLTEYSQSKETAMKEINEIRAQVESGLQVSAGAKAWVSEYTIDKNRYPASNEQLGMDAPADIQGEFVSSVEVRNGNITITYGRNASPKIAGKTLKLVPGGVSGRSLSWTCKSRNIDRAYRPEGCR